MRWRAARKRLAFVATGVTVLHALGYVPRAGPLFATAPAALAIFGRGDICQGSDLCSPRRRASRRAARRAACARRATSNSSATGINDADATLQDGVKKRLARLSNEAHVSTWLKTRVQTSEVQSIGLPLFVAKAGAPRDKAAQEVLEKLRGLLQEPSEGNVSFANDAAILAVHCYAAQAGAWFGANAWTKEISRSQKPPGLKSEAMSQVFLRGIGRSVTSEELCEVVDAFVAANWGDPIYIDTAAKLGFEGVAVSAPPQLAALHYSIGALWGYALRGLVRRLAFDRALGSVPETSSSQRQRLERQLRAGGGSDDAEELGRATAAVDPDAGVDVGAAARVTSQRPTLSQYASELFGHHDWVALCQPADAAMAALESEMQDALPGLVMLATEMEELESYFEEEVDDEDEDDDHHPGVLLRQETWEALERRGVAFGALMADAEAFVEASVGSLPRGERPSAEWMDQLVNSGALTKIRAEQGGMLAVRLAAPLRRLTEVLRTSFLAGKLREARHGLDQLYAAPEEEQAASGAAKDDERERRV
mmetsp:Transcript_106909/g.300598  ORF Transcript_106909/g.300598 Transcript_106909/m.300598 type:complete len:538 (+) Transcript_106909:64-1677(+)